jgi:hypothetical protein
MSSTATYMIPISVPSFALYIVLFCFGCPQRGAKGSSRDLSAGGPDSQFVIPNSRTIGLHYIDVSALKPLIYSDKTDATNFRFLFPHCTHLTIKDCALEWYIAEAEKEIWSSDTNFSTVVLLHCCGVYLHTSFSNVAWGHLVNEQGLQQDLQFSDFDVFEVARSLGMLMTL